MSSVIPFDSARWTELRHAFGSAGDVPGMLDRLGKGDATVMADLFGYICHQGTPESASYAAVPHLVEISRDVRDPELRAEILVLIGAIAAATDLPDVPADLRVAYEAALPLARDLALKTLNEAIKPSNAVYLLEAAATLDGRTVLGRWLTGFVDEEFLAECPNCHRELFLWPAGDGLTVAAEDPAFKPETSRTPIVPGPEPAHEAEYRWLLRVGGAAALALIAGRLPSLFGRGTCPGCGGAFSVMEQLAPR